MQVECCSTSEVASWRPYGRGDPTDWERGQQADVRWLAQVECICREAPRRLMELSRHQYGLARQHLRLLRGEWRGRHRPVAWALPAAMMAAMLGPPLLARADSPIAGPEFRVNTYTLFSQAAPSVAVDADGDFVVAWESYGQDGSNLGVYAQRYDSGSNALGSEFQVNTYTTDLQMDPSVAMDADGDFVVAWHSVGQDGSGYGVYARRYDSGGTPQGSEFLVNTYTAYAQAYPSVAVDADGDFMIAWDSYGQYGGIGKDVYVQRYDSGGVAQGSEFRVNTHTTGWQVFPSLAVDPDGDYVITWHSGWQDGSFYGVYARRYDSGGVAQGFEFLVNTYTTEGQEYPSVAVDADGDFMIAWESTGQDGDAFGVYAQRYDSGGVAQGSEFRVNTYTTSWQRHPSVAVHADGDFVVSWDSSGQDGSVDGVYAQRYDSDGVAQGSEFRVNTYTTGSQQDPSVAVDADGDFVVAWQSGQDGSGYGVYARRYHRLETYRLEVYLPVVLRSP